MLDSFGSSLQLAQYLGLFILFDFKGHLSVRPQPDSDAWSTAVLDRLRPVVHCHKRRWPPTFPV